MNVLDYALQNPQARLRRPLFWRTGGCKVVQDDGWKLQLQEQNRKAWLYNLNEDSAEQNKLSESGPEQLQTMMELRYSLDTQMMEPGWPSLVEAPIAVGCTVNNLSDGDYETII